jgi:hypothetical protein
LFFAPDELIKGVKNLIKKNQDKEIWKYLNKD